MKLKNKVALITGGNSGIGLATARRFVTEGARVVVTGRNRQRLDRAAAELGPNAVASKRRDRAGRGETVVATAIERFGRLDIVFANAGIAAATPVGQTAADTFNDVLRQT